MQTACLHLRGLSSTIVACSTLLLSNQNAHALESGTISA
jgi:hypothetical protein